MKPYRANWKRIEAEPALREDEGWVNMRVQFLLGAEQGSEQLLLGRTVLPPGARHERHSHPHADEFLFVARGEGVVYTDEGEEASAEGDVIFTPRGHWHGFNNTSSEEVLLFWGWVGAGSLAAAGYALPDGHQGSRP